MRWRLRTLMAIVALLALGFASPDPVLAITLIFACPIWVPVIVYSRRASTSRGEGSPRSGCAKG